MNKKLLALLFATFLLAACTPDPRKEAQAYAIKSQADQQAAADTQARAQGEEMHLLELQRQAIKIGHQRATAAQWDATANQVIQAFGYLAIISLAVIAYSVSRASIGISLATVQAANLRASLIQLNPITRQFPLVIKHIAGHIFAVHNPNTNSVILIDERNAPDRQMIAAAGVTQVTGVLAQEASRGNDPAGMAMIRPPVIDAKDEDVSIGDHFLEHLIEG